MKQNKYSSQAQNICPMCFFLLMVKLAVLGWTKKRMGISKWQDQNCHLRPCTLGQANKNLGVSQPRPRTILNCTTGSSNYRHSILSLSSVKTALYHQTSLCWNLKWTNCLTCLNSFRCSSFPCPSYVPLSTTPFWWVILSEKYIFAKSSLGSDYCLSLTQHSQSESGESVSSIE